MKLGYSLPSNQGFEDPLDIVSLAEKAESVGLNSVWASEHLFHSSYIADRLDNRPYYEPLSILSAVAMRTKTVRLGTTVIVLPWHDPPRLGKTVATLDKLSNGRVDLGVGVATTEDEYVNLGVDFKTRGKRANEILSALQALWTQEIPEYSGEFYRYSGLKFSPKPQQKPYPPIHVGGSSMAALRRTARFGDGWHTLRQSPNDIREKLPILAQLMQGEGRDPDGLYISLNAGIRFDSPTQDREPDDRKLISGSTEDIIETLRAFAAAGCHEVVVSIASRERSFHEDILDRISSEVMPNI